MNIRAQAAQVLAPLLGQHGSLKAHLPEALKQCPVEERPLLQQLCYGTLRELYRLNALAESLLQRPFREADLDLQALLLIGLYQLRSMRIPAHAAVNETVNAITDLNKPWARKLFNAVLRRYQREQQTLEQGLEQHPGFRCNHPQWMIDKLSHNWPGQWQEILQQNDRQAPMTLRINKRLLTRDKALALLSEHSIDAYPGQFCDSAIYLEHAVDIARIPGFEQGYFSVQDEAAQLACELLACQPGDRVLDACAAPGGKLCHLLEANPQLGEVVAVEMEPARAERIRDNLARLHLASECLLHLGDASASSWWDGKLFDRILVDAPCSGTGVIRRNPDIKLLRRNEDIVALADMQLAILGNLWPMLKPGGRLVYATCSVFSQENERVIERFAKQHSDLQIEPIAADWGIQGHYGRQLFPQERGHDGFFYAVLTKADTAD